MNDENIEEQNKYEETLQNDANAIDAYIRNIYIKSVPEPIPPTKKDLSFWNIAGLELSMFVLSAIGSAVLSAVRTGGLFYILEVKLIEKFQLDNTIGNSFGFVAMAASLLAFEGFILAYGLTKGKESGKVQISKLGLGISFLTIAAAGIFSSLGIVTIATQTNDTINVIMAAITGLAAAFVAFFSSENFGYIINHVATVKNKKISDHQFVYSNWRDGAIGAYLKSSYNIRLKKSGKIYGIENTQQVSVQNDKQEEAVDRGSSDWRKVRPTLGLQELENLARLTPDAMEILANKRGITVRTVSNWREYARKELNIKDEKPSLAQENNGSTSPSEEVHIDI